MILAMVLGTEAIAEYAEPAAIFGNIRAVALGDSIAAGHGVKEGYPELAARLLRFESKYKRLELENLAVNGLDTEGLMRLLYHDPDVIHAVTDSDIVFVSIGGNNILGPVGDALNKLSLYGKTAEQAAEEINRVFLSQGGLLDSLAAGTAAFVRDWTAIYLRIRELAPDAMIEVLTVYNPAAEDNRVVYPMTEMLLGAINKVIRDNAGYGGYNVIDAHEAFEIGDKRQLTRFDLINLEFDPHPTEAGHELLAQLNCAAVLRNR